MKAAARPDPALDALAKELIDEGKLGKIFHYRAKFLQDWTISRDLPQGGEGLWRLDVGVAGIGDDAKGEVVKAWVVRKPGTTPTADDLRAQLVETQTLGEVRRERERGI